MANAISLSTIINYCFFCKLGVHDDQDVATPESHSKAFTKSVQKQTRGIGGRHDECHLSARAYSPT